MPQHNLAEVSEPAVYNLFRKDSTSEYKQFVITVVYSRIASDNGITLDRLKKDLQRKLLFDSSDIDAAVVALTNENLFNCVSKFEVSKKINEYKPIHLRTRRNTQSTVWSTWINRISKSNPELVESSSLLVM